MCPCIEWEQKIRDTQGEKAPMMAKTSAAFPMGVAEVFDYRITRLDLQKQEIR